MNLIPDNKPSIAALIWDFDNTLADTRTRNLNVTRRIVNHLCDHDIDSIPALASIGDYENALNSHRNWQDFYIQSLGFSRSCLADAGRCWTLFQLDDPTPVTPLPILDELLFSFRSVPQAIVSQNSSRIISKFLSEIGKKSYFKTIVGYEEVGFDFQKPHPRGLLTTLNNLFPSGFRTAVYIGDQDTDILCAQRAQSELRGAGHMGRILTIGVEYWRSTSAHIWDADPNYTASVPSQLYSILQNLHHDCH